MDDMRGIRDHIARDSSYYAERFIARLFEAAEHLHDHPRMGRRVPEADDDTIRELIVGSYRIIYAYAVEPEQVSILAVVHGARDLAGGEIKPWEV
jgi:plasmid stabilization system protein ParE